MAGTRAIWTSFPMNPVADECFTFTGDGREPGVMPHGRCDPLLSHATSKCGKEHQRRELISPHGFGIVRVPAIDVLLLDR